MRRSFLFCEGPHGAKEACSCFGIAAPAQWQKLQAIYKEQKLVQGTVPASELGTSQLIEAINKFDQAAIMRQAKEYKL